MTLSKKERELLLKRHCGVINEDDAIDPRHYFYNKRKSNKKFRKAYQLCRQVADTLRMTLGECDPKLLEVSVVDVLPAPDSKRLLVIVKLDPSMEIGGAEDVEQIFCRLQSNIPQLRSEIARTINRRKTPNLIFEIARIE